MDIQGKVPPQAIELEQAVLGAAMLEQEGAETAIRILSEEKFYTSAHRSIFNAICQLHKKDQPIDILTVTEKLREQGELDQIGGAYYITQLTDRVASSANIEAHARIIEEKYFRREVIRISSESMKSAYEETEDVFDLLQSVDHSYQKINETIASGTGAKSVEDILVSAGKELSKREKLAKAGKCTGVATGLKKLNRITGGWQPANLIILAARPSMGKTALMLFFAKQAALSGVPVCIYSLEMSGVSLINRLILSSCDIDIDHFRSGFMSESDWSEFDKATAELHRLPIYVDDNPVVSMNYIKNHSRVMHRKGKCGIIFIDYLQLADMRSQEKNRNREQEVAQATRQAKIIAKTLGVPVVLLSQLSRDVEKRGGEKRPTMSDLRESGAIEQDADIVSFIFRPAYYGIGQDEAGNSTEGYAEFIIAKNRDGSTDTVTFWHNKSMTKIFSARSETTETAPF